MKEKRLIKVTEKQSEHLIRLLYKERLELLNAERDTEETDDLLLKIAMSPVVTKWI